MLGARTLLGAPGLTRSKKLLGTKGATARSKDATRGSWPATRSKKLLGTKGIATRGSWPYY